MSASKSNLVYPGLPPRVGGINLNEQESREFRERLQHTIKAKVCNKRKSYNLRSNIPICPRNDTENPIVNIPFCLEQSNTPREVPNYSLNNPYMIELVQSILDELHKKPRL